jgi:hypothetical protein
MSRRTTTNSQYRSGDRVSERAARSAMAHFRAAAAKGTSPAAAPDPQILRRWRVADLIAAASRPRRAFA